MGNSGSSQYLSSSQFWAGKLSYFDHESVLPVPVSFNEDDVANLIMAILDEPIIRVSIWKSDLYPGQLSKPVLYHAYLVVRTPRFWWTIEKNDGGIVVQRSLSREKVVNRLNNEERLGVPEFIDDDDCKSISIGQLLRWIWVNGELRKTYDWARSNCKHFARDLFNRVAFTKQFYHLT